MNLRSDKSALLLPTNRCFWAGVKHGVEADLPLPSDGQDNLGIDSARTTSNPVDNVSVMPKAEALAVKLTRRVEAFRREIGPAFFLENQTVEFVIPENF